MIAQIAGTLLEATPNMAVVDVHGIGFELGISGTTAALLPVLGGEVRLHTRMVVREDAMMLFGFATKEERTMFDKLVAVSGVGAKLALAILSTYSVGQLFTVVTANDDKAMAKVPGVGKKTAQRLILELKSVFDKDRSLAGAEGVQLSSLQQTGPASSLPSALDDATAALLSMGFTSPEIELALGGYDGANMRVEDLLAAALKRLGMDA